MNRQSHRSWCFSPHRTANRPLIRRPIRARHRRQCDRTAAHHRPALPRHAVIVGLDNVDAKATRVHAAWTKFLMPLTPTIPADHEDHCPHPRRLGQLLLPAKPDGSRLLGRLRNQAAAGLPTISLTTRTGCKTSSARIRVTVEHRWQTTGLVRTSAGCWYLPP